MGHRRKVRGVEPVLQHDHVREAGARGERRQTRLIKKLFGDTKVKAAAAVMAVELRRSMADEVKQYQEGRHEMVLARAK